MKIVVLNPPFIKNFSRQSRSPCVSKGGALYYPYYAAYMVGYLEKEGHSVRFIDAVARNMERIKVVKMVREISPKLVFIDTSTPSIYNDIEVAEKIKETCPTAHICLTGTHPTILSEETLELSKKVDSVIRGEYELTASDLARALEEDKGLRNIDGLSYRNGKEIIHNKERKEIKNLDAIPWVSKIYKKHLRIKDYFLPANRYPMLMILTSRGCPFDCNFCNIPFKNSYRTRVIDNVIAELKHIEKEMPDVKEVFFEDDTWNVDEKRVKEFCKKVINKGVKLTFSCNMRTNASIDMLKLMKKAGFRLACCGFESAKQDVLKRIDKKMQLDTQKEFVKNCKKAGILVHGCFILGLKGDTLESIRNTIEYAKSLDIDSAQFFNSFAYPGTEFYKWVKDNGYLETEDYSKWIRPDGTQNCVISRPGLKSKDLVRLCDKAREEFYLRKKYVAKKIVQAIGHPQEAKRLIRSGKTFKKYLWRKK